MAAKRFTAFCEQCYSARLENVGIRKAEQWATSHGNVYGHRVAIVPYTKATKAPAQGYNVTANPPLAVVNPPRARVVGTLGRPISIRYQHATDNKFYEHKFGRTARIVLLDDGSVRIESTQGKTMWGDF